MTPCHNTVTEIADDKFTDFSAGCDPDFDTDFGDLERQFAAFLAARKHFATESDNGGRP